MALILNCPACQEPVSLGQMPSTDNGLLECRACGHRYHIEGKSIDPGDRSYKAVASPPPNIEVAAQVGQLRILCKQPAWQKGVLLGVTALFIGGYIFAYTINPAQFSSDPFMIIFTTAVVLAVILFNISALRNQELLLKQYELQVGYTWPSFMKNARVFDPERILQFYVKERRVKSGKSTKLVFDIMAALEQQPGGVQVLKGLGTAQEAYFVEGQLERFYHLKDIPVAGEFDTRAKATFSLSNAVELVRHIFRSK